MKKPIELASRRKKSPKYIVEINSFDEDDREAMAAWNEMWRMLLAPLLHPVEQSKTA